MDERPGNLGKIIILFVKNLVRHLAVAVKLSGGLQTFVLIKSNPKSKIR